MAVSSATVHVVVNTQVAEKLPILLQLFIRILEGPFLFWFLGRIESSSDYHERLGDPDPGSCAYRCADGVLDSRGNERTLGACDGLGLCAMQARAGLTLCL